MIKKTFLELLEVDAVVAELYKQDPTLKDTKFGYAYTKFHKKNITPTKEEFTEKVQDMWIDKALEDPTTKAIVRDEKSTTGYAHLKEELKKGLEEQRKISKEYEVIEIEVEPYISSYVPENLTENQKEMLAGLVL